MNVQRKSDCVAFLELENIARGIETVDALFKKASIDILFSSPISSGKYIVCFCGEVEDTKSALNRGKEVAGNTLLDFFLIPNFHEAILPVFHSKNVLSKNIEAIGILETTTCAKCLIALDSALKTSDIAPIKLELGKGIGGKAYFIIEGEVGEVESALLACVRSIKKEGIIEKVIIPQVTSETLSIF